MQELQLHFGLFVGSESRSVMHGGRWVRVVGLGGWKNTSRRRPNLPSERFSWLGYGFYRGVKEWALAMAAPCRPQTFPAGTLLVPLSEPSSRRIDPLRGPCPPLPPAAAPPKFHQKRKLKISAAGAHVEKRGVADDLLANWLTLPQPPQRGGMAHEATKFAL